MTDVPAVFRLDLSITTAGVVDLQEGATTAGGVGVGWLWAGVEGTEQLQCHARAPSFEHTPADLCIRR